MAKNKITLFATYQERQPFTKQFNRTMNFNKTFLFTIFFLIAFNGFAQLKEDIAFTFDKGELKKSGGTPNNSNYKPEKLNFFINKEKDKYETSFNKKGNTFIVTTLTNQKSGIGCLTFGYQGILDPLFKKDNQNRSWELTFEKGTSNVETFSGLFIQTVKYKHYVFTVKGNQYKIEVFNALHKDDSLALREIKSATNCSSLNPNGPNTLYASRIDNTWHFLINGDTVFTYADTENYDFDNAAIGVYAEGKSTNIISAFKFAAYPSTPPTKNANPAVEEKNEKSAKLNSLDCNTMDVFTGLLWTFPGPCKYKKFDDISSTSQWLYLSNSGKYLLKVEVGNYGSMVGFSTVIQLASSMITNLRNNGNTVNGFEEPSMFKRETDISKRPACYKYSNGEANGSFYWMGKGNYYIYIDISKVGKLSSADETEIDAFINSISYIY